MRHDRGDRGVESIGMATLQSTGAAAAATLVMFLSGHACGGLDCPGNLRVDLGETGSHRHGRALSFNGRTAAVADPGAAANIGAVYVSSYGEDSWSDVQTLEGTTAGGQFGTEVATTGDWLAVGVLGSGSSHISMYEYSMGSWNVSGSLIATPGYDMTLRGGGTIAMDGDWLAVAMEDSTTGLAAVGMYHYEDGSWGIDQVLNLAIETGVTLDLDNDLLAIGTPEANSDAGGVILYEYLEYLNNLWTWWEVGELNPGPAGAKVGQSVAVSYGWVAYTIGGDYVTSGAHPYPSIEIVELLNSPRGDTGTWTVIAAIEYGDVPTQINDIDLDWVTLGAVTWGTDGFGAMQTQVYALSGWPLSVDDIDFSPPSGAVLSNRYQVAISNDRVLFDAATIAGYRVVNCEPAEDCDGNQRSDTCDFTAPGSDLNEDNVLDRCACPGNANADVDSTIDGVDVWRLINVYWGDTTGSGDFNGDDVCDVLDLLITLENWGDCP